MDRCNLSTILPDILVFPSGIGSAFRRFRALTS